jgi:hypothetical protein
VSTTSSDPVPFKHYNEVEGQGEPCPGHTLRVAIHNTSDTVAIEIDGKADHIMDHGEYEALVKAIESLKARI